MTVNYHFLWYCHALVREIFHHNTAQHLTCTHIICVGVYTHDFVFFQANDVPKFPCPTQANFSYNNVTGAGSLAVEFVSSSITSGWE
jgi:hypothetical protein